MIRVVLVESIVWNNRDRITVTSDPGALLDSFKQYRPQISTQHDSAMLLTYVIGKIVVLNTIIYYVLVHLVHCSGIDLDNSTAGIAVRRSMCSERDSVGVTQDGGRSLSSVASTAAHEMGHIFNMGHDGKVHATCAFVCINLGTRTSEDDSSFFVCL